MTHRRPGRRRRPITSLAIGLALTAGTAGCTVARDDADRTTDLATTAVPATAEVPDGSSSTVVGRDDGRPSATATTARRRDDRLVAALGEDVGADGLVVPERPADAGSWKFLATTGDGPVAFNPCRPIRYRIRTGPGPANAAELVRDAIERLEAATGLRFEEDGLTDDVPTSASFPAADTPVEVDDAFTPLTIGWALREETDLWAERGADTLGVGGPRTLAFDNGQRFAVSGYVLLVPSEEVAPRFGPGLTVGNVLLHELGHLVGLDHVADAGELMVARLGRPSPDGYGPGDRRGLWELGAARGCASAYLHLP